MSRKILKSADEKKEQNVYEGRVTRRTTRNLPENVKKELLQQQDDPEKEPIIEDLPELKFAGRLYFVTDFDGCAMICDQIIERIENHPEAGIIPIGFDLEWPFSFQTGPGKTALAQLCVTENTCHLLHIYNLQTLPAALIVLLTHPRVKLVGVNIKNDIWKLGRDFKEFPSRKAIENCIDCGPYCNKVYRRSCRWSLERLTAYILKKRISKDGKVRKSKWHILPLSEEQKYYAATDAYVSLLTYLTIQKREEENAESEKSPEPPKEPEKVESQKKTPSILDYCTKTNS